MQSLHLRKVDKLIHQINEFRFTAGFVAEILPC